MNSKQKGKRGELELSQFLRDHGYPEARRGVQYKGGTDSPDVCGIPGLHIECKRVEALSLYEAMAQATKDASNTKIPLVAHRRNGRPHHPLPWLAILSLADFLAIYQDAMIYRQQHGEPDADPA